MDTMMWVVLVGALVLAIVMAVVAWRMLRSDRERTEARAAMLRQKAFEPEPALSDRVFQAPTFPPSLLRSSGETGPHLLGGSGETGPHLLGGYGETGPHLLEGYGETSPPPTRKLMAVAVVIVFMAVGAASVYGIYKPGGAGSDGGLSRRSSAGAEAELVSPKRSEGGAEAHRGSPLELISLSHRNEADDFVVAGLVQNPGNGSPASSVMAVVYVFNAKGEYFASGKASLEFVPLAPGAESPFVVRIPKTSGVSRFRVGFRALDGSVVAHVDRRGKPIEGTTGGTMPNSPPQSGGL